MKWKGKHHEFYDWLGKADKEELKEYITKRRRENFPWWKKAWKYIKLILFALILSLGILGALGLWLVFEMEDDVNLLGEFICEDYSGKISIWPNGDEIVIECMEKNFKIVKDDYI